MRENFDIPSSSDQEKKDWKDLFREKIEKVLSFFQKDDDLFNSAQEYSFDEENNEEGFVITSGVKEAVVEKTILQNPASSNPAEKAKWFPPSERSTNDGEGFRLSTNKEIEIKNDREEAPLNEWQKLLNKEKQNTIHFSLSDLKNFSLLENVFTHWNCPSETSRSFEYKEQKFLIIRDFSKKTFFIRPDPTPSGATQFRINGDLKKNTATFRGRMCSSKARLVFEKMIQTLSEEYLTSSEETATTHPPLNALVDSVKNQTNQLIEKMKPSPDQISLVPQRDPSDQPTAE